MERETGTFRVKAGLAEMLKGGVIMDVTTADQAKIAEDAGACAVMALERVPRTSVVTAASRAWPTRPRSRRSSRPSRSRSWRRRGSAISWRRRSCSRSGVDYIDESEVLTPGRRGAPHRQVGVHGAVRVRGAQPRRGAPAHRRGRGDDPHEGRGRHRQRRRGGPSQRTMLREMAWLTTLRPEQYVAAAKDLGAPVELVRQVAATGTLPVVNFAAGGLATPADAALMMQLGVDGGVRRLGDLQVRGSGAARARDRRGDDPLQRPGRAGQGVARARRARCPVSTSRRSARRVCSRPAVGKAGDPS